MIEAGVLSGTYLVAAIPFGYLLGRASGVDVRRGGSGNIGATNVMRLGGRWLGIVTLLLDALKGAVAVWAARRLAPEATWLPLVAALVAIVGHCYPIYLGLRGGKGVATAAGAFFALDAPVALWALAAFAAVVGLSRRVSAASMAAAVSLPLAAWLLGREALALWAAAAALILWRHRGNLRRLLAGEEPALGSARGGGGP